MQYTKPDFLYPPRPENAVASGMLAFYEKRGWWAQVKKNGDCCVILTNGRDVVFKTRHGDDVGRWSPTKDILNFFGGQKTAGKWNVYVAELLHSHGTLLKNNLYIFDTIVRDGIQLVGTTFASRQEILAEQTAQWREQFDKDWVQVSGGQVLTEDSTRVHPNVSVAKNITSGFGKLFKEISEAAIPDDEGLVLKNPKGILQPCFRQTANDGWMVKVRRPNKNLSF
jgi:hypothetical protein